VVADFVDEGGDAALEVDQKVQFADVEAGQAVSDNEQPVKEIFERMRIRMCHRLIYDREELLTARFTGFVHRNPGSPWSGLISYLEEICCGNVHEKGVIEITCSSTGRNHCWDVANYQWNDYWLTNNVGNSWIQIDFKEWFVSPTHYSLKSDGGSGHHLVEWELRGSLDGHTWVVLDERRTKDLDGRYITTMFCCNGEGSCMKSSRYIRLHQTGKNSFGDDHFMLGNTEFFGLMTTS
jgi:hypothetical protein